MAISKSFLKDVNSLLVENYSKPEIKSSYIITEEISLEDYNWLNEYNNYLNEGIEYILLDHYDFIEEGVKDYLKSKADSAKGFINSLVADRKNDLGINDSNPSTEDKKKSFLKKFDDLGQKHKADARQKIDNTLVAMPNNKHVQSKLAARSDLSINHIDRLIGNASRIGNKPALSILAMRHDLRKTHIDGLIKNHKHLNDDAFKRLLSNKHIDSSHIDELVNSGNERAMKHAANHDKASPQQISKLLDSNHPGVFKNALIRTKAILNTRCNC